MAFTAPEQPQQPPKAGREALSLSFTWWHLHRRYMAELQSDTGLSPMEIQALRSLNPGSAEAMTSLADRIHCEPSNITTVVDRLEAAGMVQRPFSPRPGNGPVTRFGRASTSLPMPSTV